MITATEKLRDNRTSDIPQAPDLAALHWGTFTFGQLFAGQKLKLAVRLASPASHAETHSSRSFQT
jgi:hypothetical protein